MGCLDDGSLRAFHCAGRIPGGPARLSTPIPRPHSHGIVSQHRALKSSASGNNVPVGQGGDRGIKSAVALPRILQSAVLGAQDRRVIPSGVRLKILEPVCPQGEVQNDHSQNSDKCDAQGRLGGQYRSERCLLSHPYSRPVQTSATVRHSNQRRAPSFPIQGPTVRSDVCPTDFYQGNSSVGTPCSPACSLPSSVSRRLATEKSKHVTVGSANKLVAGYHSLRGICAKRAQITTSADATFDTYRGGISAGLRSNVPSDDQSSKVRRQDIDTPVGVSHDSLFLAVPPRTSELSNRCNSTRQIASQTSATVFACSLVPASKDLKALVPVKHDLLDHHLRWWLDRKCTRAGMLLDVPEAQARLFTDASQSGWGAHLDKDQVSGSWSTREATLHINHLEMLAVLYALRAFRVQLTGLTVQLMSDNSSVVSYIRKQGGTVSVPLYRLTREVLILARDAHITLLAKHIPGERNALADLLSRMNKIVHSVHCTPNGLSFTLCSRHYAWRGTSPT